MQKSFDTNFLMLLVYNPVVKIFEYFKIEVNKKRQSLSVESIKEDKFWQKYYFSTMKIKSEQITEKVILRKFNSWKLNYKNIHQFPLEFKNGNNGILFVSFINDDDIDSKDSLLLNNLTQAIGNRISELRRLFGTKRGEDSQNLVSRDLFHRLNEDEIFIHVTKTLIKIWDCFEVHILGRGRVGTGAFQEGYFPGPCLLDHANRFINFGEGRAAC